MGERKTDLNTEFWAGVTTFMTMAYVVVLQPNFMARAGMDKSAVIAATAVMCGLFSIIMGLYAKLPFALGPGVGSAALLSATIVADGLASWQVGLGMVFISGSIFVLITLLGLRETVVKLIPRIIKVAISVSVGFFITSLGMRSAGFYTVSGTSLRLGNLANPQMLLALFGLLVTAVLMVRKVRGALLIGIILTTIAAIPLDMAKVPAQFFSAPTSMEPVMFKLDILGALDIKYLPFMFAFFVSDFFSTLGTVVGVSMSAGLTDKDGNVPDIQKPFLVDAVGTVVGAACGVTTITTFIESAAGVEAGGRTGITAIVTGLCFLATLFIAPLVGMIPGVATAPALIIIGLKLRSKKRSIVP